MHKSELIRHLISLFDPNPELYAIRTEWTERDSATGEEKKQVAYLPSIYEGHKETTRAKVAEVVHRVGTHRFDPLSVDAHLTGKQFIGVYPLHPDSTTRFFALDFDGKTGDPWEEAADAWRTLTEDAGIPVYIERSQSGKGYHVWGFLSERVDAGVVRRAIKPYIVKGETFDRMFPNQSKIHPLRPLGNLIALPFFGPRVISGCSRFVQVAPDGSPEEIDDQKAFIAAVERIPAAAIQELAENAPELPEERIVKGREGAADGSQPGVLKMTDPRFGCEWIRWTIEYPEDVSEPEWYALACQLAQMKRGREIFHEISALSARYDPHHTDVKFDHAVEQNAPHTHAYIRENLKGPKCSCEERFPGEVSHPYDLGRISVFNLVKMIQYENAIEDAVTGLDGAIEWAIQVQEDPSLGRGIGTGIPVIDEWVGFRKSTLNYLAARPSLGKTAICLDFAYRMACSGVPVYFFSLEMSKQALWIRLLCRIAGVDGERLRKGELTAEDWLAIRKAQKRIKDMPHFPLYVDDTSRDIRRIMEIAWNLQEEHGEGIIMVDYLGLLDWYSGENEYSGNTRNSKESKLLAKALNCPVLMMHQFNRAGDDMGIGAQTSDSWLRSTGQIEQDADMILYLLGERGPGVQERELVKQKDRDGVAGIRIPLEFNQAIMQWGHRGQWLRLPSAAVNLGRVAFDDEDRLPGEGLE